MRPAGLESTGGHNRTFKKQGIIQVSISTCDFYRDGAISISPAGNRGGREAYFRNILGIPYQGNRKKNSNMKNSLTHFHWP